MTAVLVNKNPVEKADFAVSSEHGESKVCGDIFVPFEDGWSERLVLQHLLSTVCDDPLVAFEDVWSGRVTKKRLAFFSLEQDHQQRREG